MNNTWRTIIWQQFGAAIDMLDNALRACPDELWRDSLWNDPTDAPAGEARVECVRRGAVTHEDAVLFVPDLDKSRLEPETEGAVRAGTVNLEAST